MITGLQGYAIKMLLRLKTDSVELFNAQDIAYEYRGVKQRYDGTISCELPLNRCKARKAGATI